MLLYRLTHPEILAALGGAGHGSTVLLADGHYPVATASGPNAVQVALNLAPGTVTVTEVLRAIVDAVPIESYAVMQPPADFGEPEIFADFDEILSERGRSGLERFAFYQAARSDDLALVVQTGDIRTYANILLTLGVADTEAAPRD
jgi:L-fucose mutarotase